MVPPTPAQPQLQLQPAAKLVVAQHMVENINASDKLLYAFLILANQPYASADWIEDIEPALSHETDDFAPDVSNNPRQPKQVESAFPAASGSPSYPSI